jgi:hypothetical protein
MSRAAGSAVAADRLPSSRTLWRLTALALAVRVAFVLVEPYAPPVADERTWVDSARILSGQRVRFSPFNNRLVFHPPLYSYFIAVPDAFLGLEAARWIQVALSVLLVPAVGRVAGLAVGARAGMLAAGAAAFYPELVWFSGHFWVENLFLVLLWWAFERVLWADAAARARAAAAGGVLWGLAVLSRETALYFAPVVALWLARGRRRPDLARGAWFFLAAVLTVAPWTWRNWVVFHAFVPVSTAGGQNLFQGNARIPRDQTYVMVDAVRGRIEQYRYARDMGLQAIRDRQPAWLFEKLAEQMPMFWEAESMALIHVKRGAYGAVPPSAARAAAVVLLVPYLVVLALFVAGVASSPVTRAGALLLGFLVYYNLIHVVTHGFNRYRLPVMPIVFAFAAAGWLAVRGRPPVPWTVRRRSCAAALGVALGASVLPSLARQAAHPVYRHSTPERVVGEADLLRVTGPAVASRDALLPGARARAGPRGVGQRPADAVRQSLRGCRHQHGHLVVEELGVGGQARGHQRAPRRQVRVDLERRVGAGDARRDHQVGQGQELRQLGGRALAAEHAARGGPEARGQGGHLRHPRRLAAHEQELGFGDARRRLHQEVHALVRLEVAGVEGDRGRPQAQRRPHRLHPRGIHGHRPVHERRVLDLEHPRARRARLHAVGEALADGDDGGAVVQRVAFQGFRRPQQRTAAGEAGLSELVGDRRVDVHHQGKMEQPRQRRRQVGGLLDRVHDVVAPPRHQPGRLRDERHVERELGQRRAGAHAPDGQGHAAVVADPVDRHVLTLGIREQVHPVALAGEGFHHGAHGQRRPPHLEERLGGQEEDAQRARGRQRAAAAGAASAVSVECSPRNRSASMAAMQPLPAAVTACR